MDKFLTMELTMGIGADDKMNLSVMLTLTLTLI